ncbi:MAG: single-stranded-DNA-specific exonuclease RecJ [Pseudomonadales bacterium]
MADRGAEDVRIVPRVLPGERLVDAPPDLPPLLERIFLARGLRHGRELDLALSALTPPDGLPDLDRAAMRLADAVRGGEHILVVGDFDADGATSVALAVSLLGAMGAQHVSFLVPNRFEFGYGLSPEIVALALARSPDVIVTVDNGTASVEGVRLAAEHGVDVIVTDHHLPGSALPEALALVNPNLPGCGFSSRAMAGVGVIFYVLGAVRTCLKASGWFQDRPLPNLADWLDLVAVGTVADVVPLDHNNRVMVAQGLKRIRAGRARPGIRAIAEVSGRRLERLSAEDLGFAIGPRLNAAGRLDDMTLGIQCLLADDLTRARELATALDELNHARRALEQEMVQDAELIVATHARSVEGRFGLTVYDPAWHQGIVGIVAGRLREKFHRPVIAFAEAGDAAPDELKGSARSLPGLHIRDVLDTIASRYPSLVVRFGGHAMAAGLSVKRVHYPRFEKVFDSVVAEHLPEDALSPVLHSDGSLALDEMSLDMARRLAGAGPWGQQFPMPTFHDHFEVISQRVVGERHLKLVLKKGDRLFDAIAFRQPPLPDVHRLEALYRLDENEYRDRSTLQLVVEHLRPLA